MPWPRCVNPKQELKARMVTFSWPARCHTDRYRRMIYHDTIAKAGKHVDPEQVRPFFEISENGYEHCHLIIGWKRPVKFASFHKTVMRWQNLVESPEKSNAMHYIPLDDKEADHVNGPYYVMLKYCSDPTKQKSIDDAGLTWIHPKSRVIPPEPRGGCFWWKLTYQLLPDIELRLQGVKPKPPRGVKRGR